MNRRARNRRLETLNHPHLSAACVLVMVSPQNSPHKEAKKPFIQYINSLMEETCFALLPLNYRYLRCSQTWRGLLAPCL